MTATQDAPAPALEIGRDRRRKEDQRLITGRTRWTDNLTLPGMLHLAMVRSPFAHANIKSIDVERGQRDDQRGRRLHRQGLRRRARRLHQRLADHPRPGHARRTRRCRPTGSRSPARSSPSSWPAAPPRRATPPSWSTSSTKSCRPRSTSRRPRPTRCSRTPTPAPTSPRSGSSTPRQAGTGGDVEEAIAKARTDGIVIEREYRQQRLIPAFMEPRSVVVDPTGEQYTMWSATQIPHILRFALAATTGVLRVEDPGDRPRRRRRLRRQAPGHPRGVDRLGGRPADQQAGEVHRDPLRVADQRRTTAATSGRS